ncbi:Cell wall-associated polypeptide CWBP200 [Candidatus Ornithobacterium hominis]|uniref:Cell wall-associated polypeptide CWBP200 n=1 Tax=Candidatus Ornithobacterium hominis TaxID=2497989 RepID=A0A383U363_9FLAO|nr:RHS repeat-associated core domain-containing protein [Candidatus Ornithobacterium hominis]MCT7905269.1 RHS repeat-associated core domain-containing protein [Candidatus Ornithobacterium hominis]SZD74362.1 Cell wall-associated polypeptide CWBP200 [Candidatus Ornithobacterium hominis]
MGSSSYITDREGRITQHTEYIAFGEVLFEEHSTSKTMPYLFNGKELDSETGLYYYGARYYDAKTSIFLNVDPMAEKTMTPYAYTNNNPIMLIDPTGMVGERADHIDVRKNKDGSYTVVGGVANTDKNVYVVDEKGQRTGQILGQMLTEYSFHYDDGSAVTGSNINLNDQSGQNFFNNEIKNIGLFDYMGNAQGGEPLDFKTNNIPKELTLEQESQYHYRGMSFEGKIASARDIGNYSAGYVAGKHGQSWGASRIAFDALETKQNYKTWNVFKWRSWKTEGQPTQQAERAGHNAGYPIYKQRQFEKQWQKATNPWPIGPKY